MYADTSALIAVFIPEQQPLQRISEEVLRDLHVEYGATLVTSNWVLHEALSNLRKYGLDRCRRLKTLVDQEPFIVESITDDLETKAAQLFWSHEDKEWSMVDCAGFQLMRERHMFYAFAADRHFKQARGIFPLIEQDVQGQWRKAYEYLHFP